MDIIEHNGHAYFVNGAKPIDEGYARFFGRKQPSEEVDYFLAKRKHFIFNPKHVKDFDDLGWILGFFAQGTGRTTVTWLSPVAGANLTVVFLLPFRC
jgi:hypothetical protein